MMREGGRGGKKRLLGGHWSVAGHLRTRQAMLYLSLPEINVYLELAGRCLLGRGL